jgi:hypothetical protein
MEMFLSGRSDYMGYNINHVTGKWQWHAIIQAIDCDKNARKGRETSLKTKDVQALWML